MTFDINTFRTLEYPGPNIPDILKLERKHLSLAVLVVVAVFFNVVVVMQPYGNWVQIGKFQAINICKEN